MDNLVVSVDVEKSVKAIREEIVRLIVEIRSTKRSASRARGQERMHLNQKATDLGFKVRCLHLTDRFLRNEDWRLSEKKCHYFPISELVLMMMKLEKQYLADANLPGTESKFDWTTIYKTIKRHLESLYDFNPETGSWTAKP